MTAVQRLSVFFKDIGKDDIEIVGGKGANLGEMVNAGFPVPNGFAVTVASYNLFIEENRIVGDIENILKLTDVDDPHQLQEASRKIGNIIKRGKIPGEVQRSIVNSYKKLSGYGKNFTEVAVRSSATAEDLPEASFAGQQETYLNIEGDSNLLEAVKNCWASLFTARAIFYREHNNIPHKNVKISVIVQKMIQSEVSGVMFTLDPVKNDKDRIIIEAVWGLGELIVQGSVMPDHYVVQRETFEILYKTISNQNKELIKLNGVTKERKVPIKKVDVQKIDDAKIVKLAKYAQKLQEHYYFHQDIEWAADKKGELYILQTRPVTTIAAIDKEVSKKLSAEEKNENLTPILSGSAASPGIGTGAVKIVKTAKEIKKVKTGDVLVSNMTSPDFVPAMKKASAIITDKGGMTSHAAIVSRELGVACIVGTEKATKILKDGQVVTVDGKRGLVFEGKNAVSQKDVQVKDKVIKKTRKRKTATKLYVNLAEPDLAKKISNENVDGVGLLRAEFMIANIGIHPKEAIKRKKQKDFVKKLVSGLAKFCKEFYPRPVVYRATDFKTNEYRQLDGGKIWEPQEPNPMLGYRGAFRYNADPEVFALELKAIKKVREKYNNLWIMIPFVRSPEELTRVRKVVYSEGLFDDVTFKFWMMVELPVNVILIDKFIDVGIDGVSIGSNDLTMLLTGTDRDNSVVSEAFNERSPSVYWALRRTIKKCLKRGVTTSICGQAPSTYEDMVERLVSYGITSISVNPDAIDRVRNVMYEKEKNI